MRKQTTMRDLFKKAYGEKVAYDIFGDEEEYNRRIEESRKKMEELHAEVLRGFIRGRESQ